MNLFKNNESNNKIKKICVNWNKKYEKIALRSILKREKYAKSFVDFVKCLLSIFFFPNFSSSKNIYIFQGLQNKNYFSSFSKKEVFIIGSRVEKKFAEENGYRFIWSFAIESCVRSKVYKNYNFFINFIFYKWKKKLLNQNCIFFLREDTQPLGAFLSVLSKSLKFSKTVCIQHFFFPKNYDQIPDGLNCDYNFLWDKKQQKLKKLKLKKTYDVGIPYITRIFLKKKIPVIFVGTGEYLNNYKLYKKSLLNFFEIKNILKKELNISSIYRPHPAEYENESNVTLIKKMFEKIDCLSKFKRLNNNRSIFIGCISSMLYEAGSAGHHIVYLYIPYKYYKKWKPLFRYDIMIKSGKFEPLVPWVKRKLKTWDKKNNYVSINNYHLKFSNSLKKILKN
jgi:hypothetical protein